MLVILFVIATALLIPKIHSFFAAPKPLTADELSQLHSFYNNKVVLLTGASSGIGLSLAHLLSSFGAKLILSARDYTALLRVKESLSSDVFVLALDLEKAAVDENYPNEITKKAFDSFGKIDVLISNAGMSVRGDALETDLSVDKRIMNVNYFGTIAIVKSVFKKLQSPSCPIYFAFTSSVQGLISVPNRSAYASSKHALLAFCDAMKVECTLLRPNVHISVISPGYVNTELSKRALLSNGSTYNKSDVNSLNGYSPDLIAQITVKSIFEKKYQTIIAPNKIKIAIMIKNLFPQFICKQLVKRLKFEQISSHQKIEN